MRRDIDLATDLEPIVSADLQAECDQLQAQGLSRAEILDRLVAQVSGWRLLRSRVRHCHSPHVRTPASSRTEPS